MTTEILNSTFMVIWSNSSLNLSPHLLHKYYILMNSDQPWLGIFKLCHCVLYNMFEHTMASVLYLHFFHCIFCFRIASSIFNFQTDGEFFYAFAPTIIMPRRHNVFGRFPLHSEMTHMLGSTLECKLHICIFTASIFLSSKRHCAATSVCMQMRINCKYNSGFILVYISYH